MKKIDEKLKEHIISSLENIKKERTKRDVFYENGIDLANYQNLYLDSLTILIGHILNDKQDNIEWWLYDTSEKIIFFPGEKRKISVESAKDFVNYMIGINN